MIMERVSDVRPDQQKMSGFDMLSGSQQRRAGRCHDEASGPNETHCLAKMGHEKESWPEPLMTEPWAVESKHVARCRRGTS